MFQQKASQGLLLKGVLALALIAIAAFGLMKYNEKSVIKENIKIHAESILKINNINNYSLKSVEKSKIKLPGQLEISMSILTKSFPSLVNYKDGDVWQVIFNGETGDLEYSVIFDSNGETAIAAFKNDKRAVPGIEPLKLQIPLGSR